MKRVLALICIAALMIGTLAACAKRDPEDKGAIFSMYLAGDPSNTNLDPAKMIYTADSMKFIGLIFEGLMKVTEDGKIEKAMASKYYTKIDEEEGTYSLFFELRTSRWNDGRPVSADDFTYAWKRILEPAFSSPAAPLLYEIKNARKVKNGEMTIDDLGIYAIDSTVLQIDFEGPFDVDKFLEKVASPALVPLREDTISTNPEDWTSKVLTLLTNGPFAVKTMEYNKGITLERCSYYYTNPKSTTEAVDKYVTPYRIYVELATTIDEYEKQYAENAEGNLMFYLGTLPADKYESYGNKVETPMMSSFSFYINNNKKPFDKAEVRQALSIALDRNKIASLVGLGVKPATGIIPEGVFDATKDTSFRTVGGDLIPAGGDMAKAKSLLQTAGVSSGKFEIKHRPIAGEKAAAEYAAGVWKELGFDVTLKEVRGKAFGEDVFNVNYDMIGIDYQAISTDAFSTLAAFAVPFCGNVVTFGKENESVASPHITGFKNAAYDALTEEIYAARNDAAVYTAKLHDLEKMFVEQSPIIPLYFNNNVEVYSNDITGITHSRFGYSIFTKLKLKDYQNYFTTTEEVPTMTKATSTDAVG